MDSGDWSSKMELVIGSDEGERARGHDDTGLTLLIYNRFNILISYLVFAQKQVKILRKKLEIKKFCPRLRVCVCVI